MKKILPQKNVPAWHAEAIEMLQGNFEKIHNTFLDATKRAVWMGLFLNHIKARGREDKSIPHGEFLPWLEKNVPAVSVRQAQCYMSLSKDVAEKGHFEIRDFRVFASNGELPPAVEKIVEGKTQQQLFLEFKQAKTGEDDTLEPVRGRRPGEGGFEGHKTLEQRIKWVLRCTGRGIKELDKIGDEILLLDDTALTVALSDLERRTQLIHWWLKTPHAKRNAQAAHEFWKTL